jgi:ADP-ribosyl-[dinitrogen reductase] hydrolase
MNQDQAIGSLIGLAIGDALGTTLEFTSNPPSDRASWHTEITGGGAFNVPVGGWTDDTSMALALGYAYKSKKGFDAAQISSNFLSWWLKGEYSWANKCVDIGSATLSALTRLNYLKQDESLYQGSTNPRSSGNGGIMRLAPAVIANADRLEKAIEESVLQSRITHASEECCLYAKLLAHVLYTGDPLIDEVEQYVLPDTLPWSSLPSSGYVKDTFQTAMWAARNAVNFEQCLLFAVNRRGDADTIGAVAGQIAGAMYGYKDIPERWLSALLWKDDIVKLATEIYRESGNDEELEIKKKWNIHNRMHKHHAGQVECYSSPKEITLSEIKIEWSGPGIFGSVTVALDALVIPEPICFNIGHGRTVQIKPPSAINHRGTSYQTLVFTYETLRKIEKMLTMFFPDIKPCNYAEGQNAIHIDDGLSKRMTPEDYVEFFAKLKQQPVLTEKLGVLDSEEGES